MIKKKSIWYPWLTKLYKNIINFYKKKNYKNINIIIKYKCNLGINILILKLIKWIYCLYKNNYNICNKCLNCNLINKNSHPNFYYINCLNKKIDISYIRKINYLLVNSLNISVFKIIYFRDFIFDNFYINNFLLKYMEESSYKFMFIFSCFDNTNIPFNILSRLYKFKINYLSEKKIFNWLINNYNLNNFSYKSIISSIRLSNNSPLSSIKLLNNFWYLRLTLLNNLINIHKMTIINIINFLDNDYLIINLYWLSTIFIDFIKFKFNNIKNLFNIDVIYLFNYFNNFLNINNSYLILNKIICLNNNIKNIFNINKNILIYEFVCYFYTKFFDKG